MALEPEGFVLYQCTRLSAAISERQCEINRNGYHNPKKGVHLAPIKTCQGCTGLGSPAQVTLPVEETNMQKHRCKKEDCGRSVKKPGDFCWQHKGLGDQLEAGAVSSHQEAPGAAAEAGSGAVSNEVSPGVAETATVAEASVEVFETVAAGPAAAETAAGDSAGTTADPSAGEVATAGVTADDSTGVLPGAISAEAAGVMVDDSTGLLPGAITAEVVLEEATAVPAVRKTLLSLIAPIEKAPLPPPGLYLDFTGNEELLDWLREVSDDPTRDILALLSGVTRGEIYAPEDAAVRGE